MSIRRRVLSVSVLFAALAVGGCATTSDIDMTMDEINKIRREQAIMQQQLLGQIRSRSEQLESGQTNLDAAVSEFSSEAEGMRNQLAQTGTALADLRKSMAELRTELATLAGKVKELQHNQAIGLGSLSNRLDETDASLNGKVAGLEKKMDAFAEKVATQVAKLSKGQSAIKTQGKKRDKTVATLSKTLDTLGKKVTSELAAQNKRINAIPAGGGKGGGADVKALEKKVAFLGKKLPEQVDKVSKQAATVAAELRDYQTLLADLNKRLKALEKR